MQCSVLDVSGPEMDHTMLSMVARGRLRRFSGMVRLCAKIPPVSSGLQLRQLKRVHYPFCALQLRDFSTLRSLTSAASA
jgi:hypothetical protein